MLLSRRGTIKGLASSAAACFIPASALGGRPGESADFAQLDARMAGDVLTRSSADYEIARRTFSFNPHTDRRPAAIARCHNADDVARAVEFARRHSLEIAVRSGGHDALAASTCDDGLLIDLGRLNTIQQSASGKSVTVGPGVRAGSLLRTLAANGLVTPTGNNTNVGVGGLTLGGGLGALLASRGATCDNLLSARVLTAGGDLLRASPDENAELLWALRGGGGNFGIVTELELAAYPSPNAIGGMMVLDGQRLGDFMHFFAEYMSRAPRELVAEALVLSPAGCPLIMIALCHVGNAQAAEADIARIRRFGGVLADGIRAAPFLSVGAPTPKVEAALAGNNKLAPLWNTTAQGFAWRGGSIQNVTDGAVDTIVDAVKNAPGYGWAVGLNHHMHGAVCDVDAAFSPLPRPRNTFTYLASTRWRTPEEAEANLAWVDATWTALARHAVPSYVNYLSTDNPVAIAAAYGASYERLRRLKQKYDPDNIFHRNRNIPPA